MMHDIEFYQFEREKLIDDEVAHLTSSKGELNPFTAAHISEALMELTDSQLDDISEYCEEAHLPKVRTSEKTLEMLGRAIWCDICEYWESIAKDQAAREIPSAEELRDDAKAEHLDMQRELARDRRMGI